MIHKSQKKVQRKEYPPGRSEKTWKELRKRDQSLFAKFLNVENFQEFSRLKEIVKLSYKPPWLDYGFQSDKMESSKFPICSKICQMFDVNKIKPVSNRVEVTAK